MIRAIDLEALFKKAQGKTSSECSTDAMNVPNTYVIKLTTRCNLKCQYCYVENAPNLNSDMSTDLFERILDQIKKNTRKFTIYLHGGEPFLRLDLIYALKKWIEDNSFQKNITIMLQTNGTLIDGEIIDIIKELNINVGISLDGVNAKSNFARISSNNDITTKVIHNIRELLAKKIDIGIFSVLTSYNVNYVVDLFKYLTNIGVRNFVLKPLVLWGKAKEMNNIMASQDDMINCYKHLIDWLFYYNNTCDPRREVRERSLYWWLNGIVKSKKGYMCNCSPCGAGIQTVAIGPSGHVYICDQFYGDYNYYIGNIDELSLSEIMNSAKDQIKNLRNIFEINECKGCIWRYVCSGGCTASSYYFFGNMNSIAPECEAYKQIFSYLDIKSQQMRSDFINTIKGGDKNGLC
ncbi:MAG: radical SAM protein [Bacteroidales bacterium]|jgi:uncharacterized protein|nr:radical SAM protein [Bacteroidales bacterium]